MSAVCGTTQVIRKRADTEQLINALKSIISTEIMRHEEYGNVYPLRDHLDGRFAVVKIIYMNQQNERVKAIYIAKVTRMRRHLHNIGQLISSGRTQDAQYYYLIMPYMGISHSHVLGLLPGMAKLLMTEAISRYRQKYCLQNV